jgi:hypothetical protein
MRSILDNEQSVEVDLIFSAREALGAKCLIFKKIHRGRLWVHEFKQGGQLSKLLGGKACSNLGAVLKKANGVAINSVAQLKQIKDKMNEFEGIFRVTFVFFDGIDLSQVDRTKLVQGQVNPRRRNGQAYPLHLYPEATSGTKRSNKAGKKKRGCPKQNSKDPETSKKPRLEESSAVNSASEAGDGPQHKQSGTFLNFNKFKDKYKPLIAIEYKGTGIHILKSCSSMWTQHKRLFGENGTCEDNCRCLHKLPKLTKGVIDDYIKAQKKKSNYVEDESLKPAGVVKHFAPRFLPLLKKEYPKLTAKELVQHLVDLWPIHQKHRIFGLRCREECECDQAWEIVFCMGDKEKAENMHSKPHKRSSSGPSVKKRKLASGLGSMTTQAELEQPLAAAPLPRKPKTNSSERRPSLLKKYEIGFETFAPLGAYFITETGPSGSKCKILSVWEKGQAKNDLRIQPGKLCAATPIVFYFASSMPVLYF